MPKKQGGSVEEILEGGQEEKEDVVPELRGEPTPKPRVMGVAQVVELKWKRMPSVVGGICEHCGVAYDTCEHYAGTDIFCSYCSRRDIISSRRLAIWLDLEKNAYIVKCDDFSCDDAHNKKYLFGR